MEDNQKKEYIFRVNIPKEYRSYIEDLSRVLMIQFTANILYCFSNKNAIFFSKQFTETFLYIIVGVSVYWLIFRKIVNFGSDNPISNFWYGGDSNDQ